MSSWPTVEPASRLFGSAKELARDPLGFLTAARRRHGDVFRFRAGPQRVHFFAHPRDVRTIFTKDADVYRKEVGSRVVLGRSVLTTDDEGWARQRKQAQRYFVREQLNSLFGTIHDVVGRRLALVDPEKEAHIAFDEFAIDIVYDLVLTLLFRRRFEQRFDGLSSSVYVITDFVLKRVSSLIKWPLWLPLERNRAVKDARERFFSFVEDLQRAPATDDEPNLVQVLGADPNTSREELRNQALTFFLAGFETTANALFWTMRCLLEHRDAYGRIFDEVSTFDLDEIRSFDDMKRLAWTQACVLEGMRLFPPAWLRARRVTRDLELGGRVVPRGDRVWVSPYVTQRHPDVWTDPDRFDPERFMGERARHADPFTYFPFGGSKFICVGRDMAIQELVLIVAHLCKRFEVRDVHGTLEPMAPLASITLRPPRPWHVRFHQR